MAASYCLWYNDADALNNCYFHCFLAFAYFPWMAGRLYLFHRFDYATDDFERCNFFCAHVALSFCYLYGAMYVYVYRNTNAPTRIGHAKTVSSIDNNNDTKNQNRNTNTVGVYVWWACCGSEPSTERFAQRCSLDFTFTFNLRDTEFSTRIDEYTLSLTLPHTDS